MSKVLFIEKKLRNEKMGLMYLSAILKERGHETDLVQTDIEDVYTVVDKFNPDFFAYSICTGEHRHALQTNAGLKTKYPDKVSIFGGPHVTFFPETANNESIDYAVIGQGEKAILEIVEGRAEERILRKSFVEDINTLPLPDRNLIYKYDEFGKNPMKNIITARDCPHSCTYCYNHSYRELFKDQKDKMFQRKSVDYVIKEANGIRKNYNLDKVLFLDDNFLSGSKGGKEWVDEFCERYKSEVDLPFLCSTRVNLISEEVVKKLKKAGLEMINFALETADPYVQKEILNRGQFTNDDARNAIKLFKQYEIKCRMQNMIGLPVEDTMKDALNTLRFNKENKVDDSWVSVFQPYPGTRLSEYCIEHGFISKDTVANCADSFFDESRLNFDDQTKKKLQRLQKLWYFIVEHQMSDELVNTLLEVPMTEENMNALQDLRYACSREKLYGIIGK